MVIRQQNQSDVHWFIFYSYRLYSAYLIFSASEYIWWLFWMAFPLLRLVFMTGAGAAIRSAGRGAAPLFRLFQVRGGE